MMTQRWIRTLGAVALGLTASAALAQQPAAPAPNPTSGAALLSFELPHAEEVALEVFDVVGRRVATLVDARLDRASA